MKHKKRLWLERGKTLLITVLSLSAIYLSVQTLAYFTPDRSSLLAELNQFLYPHTSTAPVTKATSLAELVRPVRIAVTTPDGRYGVHYTPTAVDAVYEDSASLLAEGLLRAGPPARTSTFQWMQALEQTGIYYDFLGSVPLSLLSASLGQDEGSHALTQSARQLLLTDDGKGGMTLWFWDSAVSAPYRCETSSVLQGQLEQTATRYLPNNTSFAFQLSGQYGSLADHQLFTSELPTMPVYASANPLLTDIGLLESLLRVVGINPHALYTSPDGAQVARDGGCYIRVTPSGGIQFSAEEEAASVRLPVTIAGEIPTAAEAVEAAWSLLNRALVPALGDARVYLLSCDATDSGWDVRFGYLLSGAQVELAESGYAARVVVDGRRISQYSILLRTYTDTGEDSSLLPEPQAIASLLALHGPEKELLAAYLDTGEDRVAAGWIAQ